MKCPFCREYVDAFTDMEGCAARAVQGRRPCGFAALKPCGGICAAMPTTLPPLLLC